MFPCRVINLVIRFRKIPGFCSTFTTVSVKEHHIDNGEFINGTIIYFLISVVEFHRAYGLVPKIRYETGCNDHTAKKKKYWKYLTFYRL